MEMCDRVWEWARRDSECRAGGPFPGLAFFGLFPGLSSLFLSFFLFWDWEVSVSFSCLTSLFVCARARAFLFCSGWLLRFPSPLFLLSIYHPQYTSMTSADCRVISSSHVQFDGMKVRLWRSYVRIQASDGFKSAFEEAPLEGSKPTAHRSRNVGGREAGIHAHEWKQQEAPLPHCRFEKSRQASPCELTRQNRHVHAGLPRRRTTTRSPTVRLNSVETLQGDTNSHREQKKIRRQNIRLNSCSFTLKERSDSDDMVRQKS